MELKAEPGTQGEQQRETAERFMEIGRDCARLASKEWLEKDFDTELYDEQGMPR